MNSYWFLIVLFNTGMIPGSLMMLPGYFQTSLFAKVGCTVKFITWIDVLLLQRLGNGG